jgi:hypothetical protein
VGNFYTDAIERDARFESPARVADPMLLEAATRQRVGQIIAGAQKMGIALMIYETYRSQARQEQLFAAGASKLRTVGVHHYGLACDIVRDVGGEPSWKGDWTFLGELARANGMIWGGDWGNPELKHDFVDLVHVQRCTVTRQGALFGGTWYPDETYDPSADVPQITAAAVSKSRRAKPASARRARKKKRPKAKLR